MSATAAAVTMHASRVSSGTEACSRSSWWPGGGQPACAVHQTALQPQQQRWRRGHKLVAVQRKGSSGSGSSGGSSGTARGLHRLVARAAAEQEAPQRAGALMPDRQGYRSFQLDGCEFLVAEDAEGRLDLRDSYVTTDGSGSEDDGSGGSAAPSYRRPEGVGGIRAEPRQYQAVPWYSEYSGDVFQEKLGKTWVWRYYLVPIVSQEPIPQLSFEEVYVLDGKAASLAPCEVHRLAPPGTPPEELRLRIRDDVVTVDTTESLPDWEHAVQARNNGVPALSRLEVARLEEYLNALEAARQLGTIDEVEFETAYDVHWLAGMQAGGAGVQALGGQWDGGREDGQTDDAFPNDPEDDVMGGWDKEMFEDLMQFDDESDEADFEDFDSPAADY